ncbi:FtsH protease activity modulator HflK [Cohaesibacter celericrescens]|uniref:Protein HflK n=1 Tax=Cohaesibacter celericrescens TaxID=2067669 RepID=A0A2N5XWL0_9HYPH|nr:FtsH protease activity modulator HflK [Cohaesibacter celericrescens]PLW75487.1 FtsH protease activity modulator HflK [Cohaesibacter celericrescens]PLW78894.1 FtsH protease activity modulator HflK [Cohaesibacter celericrescens]
MPWSNQNGGGDGGGPWGNGGGKNGGPWGQGPQNQGPNAPDLEDLIRKGQERLRQVFPGGGGSGGGSLGAKGIGLLAAGAVAIWMVTGFYTVAQEELGVELLLGEAVGVSSPGLNYNFPYPIGRVEKVNVTQIRDITIGTRESASQRGIRRQDVPEESLMLTGDENIIDVDFKVQWNIKDPEQYLFNIDNPEVAVKQVAESAMREIVGRNNMDEIQTGDRVAVQRAAEELTQAMLDKYQSGIAIVQVQLQGVEPPEQVIDAFRDVQAAKADNVRMQNEAQAYANKVVPEAKGQSAQILEAANAYREQTVAEARGQAERFLNVLGEYEKAPEITRKRLYLETMEKVMGNSEKIILDSKGAGSQGVVPYLPLNELTKKAGN